jgi:hypothetical protein
MLRKLAISKEAIESIKPGLRKYDEICREYRVWDMQR